MSLKKILGHVIKRALFAGEPLANRFFIALTEPQQEVTVWLHGAGEPIDVTRRHCEACGAPFVLCIGFDRRRGPSEDQRSDLWLRFLEKDGPQRVLGEITLQWIQTINSGDSEFFLFRPKSSVNYCLSKSRLEIYALWHAYRAWRKGGVRVSRMERNAMEVMFICPRPVSLISVTDEAGGNIYPLNVMGDLGERFFGLCLKSGRLPAQCVQKTRRLVLSSVPMPAAPIAYRLGPNHNRPTIDWNTLGFVTRPSRCFGIPVPEFACRVREMEIDQVHKLGYHTFFLARVVSDELLANVPELCLAHGFYQDWRTRQRGVDKKRANAEDAFVSNQLSPEQARLLSENADDNSMTEFRQLQGTSVTDRR
jgi:flavin reductase (DIM6/NTAB) family NADH-FMN oxidoreductase RutF